MFTLGTRGFSRAVDGDGGRRPLSLHERRSKKNGNAETAQEKPLAPRVTVVMRVADCVHVRKE